MGQLLLAVKRTLAQTTKRWHLVLGAAAALVAGTLIGLAIGGGDDAGGQLPDLDVPQSASAESAGIVARLERASFSGTGTFVQVRLSLADDKAADADPVVRLTIPVNALALDSLPFEFASQGPSVSPGEAAVARLVAAPIQGQAVFAFTAVTLTRQSGATETVGGAWRLPLDTPSDLPQRLRVEHLASAVADDQGVKVTVESAMRSLLETLVTIRVDGPNGLAPVGNPWLLRDGDLVAGGLVAQDGNRYTYSFPATSFGSAIEAHFGPFTLGDSSTSSGTLRLDTGAIIKRGNLSGRDGESAPVIPSDVVGGDGAALVPTRVDLSSENSVAGGASATHRYLGVTLEGILGPTGPCGGPCPNPFTAADATGKPLDARIVTQGYHKDISGNINSPETQVGLFYDSLEDLDGVITLNFLGDTSDLVRGDWSVRLSPQP